MTQIRVALVEDDPLIRALNYSFLTRQPELNCVICANSAEDLLAQLEEALPPQVILLEIGLPGISGLEAIPRILAKLPESIILMYTSLDDSSLIYQALSMGATGYVLKNGALPELKNAVLEAASGGIPLSRSVSRQVIAYFKPSPRLQPTLLSPREQQILQGLVAGGSASQIASQLGLQIESVRSYVKNVYQKLRVHSRAELLARFARGEL